MKFVSNDTIITYSDLKRAFFRHLTKIKTATVICGLMVLIVLVLSEPRYRAEASFKQAGRHSDISLNMKELFQQILPLPAENETIAIMQSNAVLKDVVETLGLQVRCQTGFLVFKALKRIWENFYCEMKLPLSDVDPFRFKDVSYSGEVPLKFYLKLIGDGQFQLFNRQKQKVAEGKLNESIEIDNVKLTLKSIPNHARKDRFYPLIIEPWSSLVTKLKKNLQIRPFKLNKSVLQLCFSCRDRFLSSALLNQVMLSYQKYLKWENEELCQSQISYLEKRQHQLVKDYDRALTEHVDYLVDSLGKNGFMGFAQELETLSEPKNLYISKLFDVDAELSRYLSIHEPLLSKALLENEGVFAKNSDSKSLKIHDKDPVGISPLLKIGKGEKNQIENLDLVQKRADDVEAMLSLSGFPKDESHDFAGLSLDTAQRLMVEYTQQRDKFQAEVKELVYLKGRLIRPEFELSSLGAVINEPVTNELIHKASAIALQLQDNGNRSEREQERLMDTLKTQKSFLSQYVVQTIELKKLRIALLEEKMGSLNRQIIHLLKSEKELIGKNLDAINSKMKDLPEKWRRESLLMLKKEIGSMMVHSISQLTETKFLSQNIFQVTSKPLDIAFPPKQPRSNHILLFSIFAALLGGGGAYFLLFCRDLLKGLPSSYENLKLSGFPVSGALSHYCDTELNQMKETDLETMRHLTEFLSSQMCNDPNKKQGITAVCVGGKYPNYSQGLAGVLALRGLKVLVIQYAFDQVVHPEQLPGLWQYLNSEVNSLHIRHRSTYDEVTSGGTTRHAAELIDHPKFKNLLNSLKEKYDVILLFSSADAAKAEGLIHLKVADAAIITVHKEKKEDLLTYCEWAQKKGTHCASFVCLY